MNTSMAMPVTKQIGMIFLSTGASGMLDGCGFMKAMGCEMQDAAQQSGDDKNQ